MKEETKLALLQRDVETIKKSQDRMELALAALQGMFWTTKGHEEFVVDVNKRFDEIENRIGSKQFTMPIIASVLTAVITFLLIEYLQHFK